MTQKAAPEDQGMSRPLRISLHPGLLLMLILIGFGLGAGAYRLARYSSGGVSAAVAIETYAKASHLVREGERIRVPPNSPLRGKLTVEAAAAKEIQRTLVIPAVVEADPARTLKVLPPVAGRVIDLKI